VGKAVVNHQGWVGGGGGDSRRRKRRKGRKSSSSSRIRKRWRSKTGFGKPERSGRVFLAVPVIDPVSRDSRLSTGHWVGFVWTRWFGVATSGCVGLICVGESEGENEVGQE
jgi:hypothetical protein